MTDYERLIERWLPLRETNLSSTIEKTFKQARAQYKSEFEEIFGAKAEVLGINFPVVPNLHTWFARRPCSAARVTTLASILPSSVSKEDFMNSVGFTEFSNILKKRELPIIYAVNPNRQKIVEILQKARLSLIPGYGEKLASWYAVLAFFAGIPADTLS